VAVKLLCSQADRVIESESSNSEKFETVIHYINVELQSSIIYRSLRFSRSDLVLHHKFSFNPAFQLSYTNCTDKTVACSTLHIFRS